MPKYDAIPEFGQLVEFITQAEPVLVDGELVYGVVINSVDLVDQPIVAAAESLLADYEKIEILRPIPEVPVEEIPLVVDKITAVYHSDIAKLVTVTPNPMEIVSALAAVKTYKDWIVGEAVAIGDVRVYPMDHNLYQVIQPHTTQADWDPVTAKALWKRYYEPDDNPWEWIQPLGAHDAYPLGRRFCLKAMCGRVRSMQMCGRLV